MPRNFAVFATDLPDDTVWNDHGDCVVPGGEGVLNRLRRSIADGSFLCSPVTQHSFYGWDSVASRPGVRPVQILIQFAGDPWLLTLTNEQTFLRHLLGRVDHDVDPMLLSAVQQAVAEDDHFSNVQWLTETEYDDFCRRTPPNQNPAR